jgi:UV DNA damage endonuclease
METEIPVVFDTFHHECNSHGETIEETFQMFTKTWKKGDGIPIIHYSTRNPRKGKYAHAEQIDLAHFKSFIQETQDFDFDIMLEIKNKEKSAHRAIEVLRGDQRLDS